MILEHLPPPTQFNLACTCKQLAVASRGVLQYHQESHTKYRTASDLDPSTVPLLLRSAFGQGNPIPAWHVQSFEVWRDRTTWSDWQPFDLHTPLIHIPDSKPYHLRVSRDDLRRYLYWFEDQLGEDLGFELIEKLLAQAESGHDGLLKALLFARLERLKDVKFVTRSQEAGSCLTSMRTLIAECIKKKASDDEKERAAKKKACDCGSCTAKRANNNQDAETQGTKSHWDLVLNGSEKCALHSKSHSSPWPVGFFNIGKVAVGVASGTWMDDNRDGNDVEPCTFLFSHLLRLPSLHSIYFSKLLGAMDDYEGDIDPEEEECDYDVLPVGSSSVEHIFLHGCGGSFGECQEDLWAGPRQLSTMSFRADRSEEFDYATSTASALARAQKHSIQSLMWYGYTNGSPRNIVGDHCAILDNEEFESIKRLPALKQMSVCIGDIEICMDCADMSELYKSKDDQDNHDHDDQGNIYDEKDYRSFKIRYAAALFPRTLETLVLWDRPCDENPEDIEESLVKMIKCGRYKNLKAIYLEATEKPFEGCSPKIEESWLQEVIKAGKDSGVDVYTFSNQEGMRHSVTFTEAPDEYDLASGIHAGVRPNDWVFDPYMGRRIPPHDKAEQYGALWERLASDREAWLAAR